MKIAAWPAWKKGIAALLVLFVAADVALVLVLWQFRREGPQAMRLRRVHLAERAQLLRADVARGEQIRQSLPEAGRQCDEFYHQAFFDSTTGYSQVEADLNAISKRAGVETSGLKFQQKAVKDRGATEVDVSTKITADYPSLIRFINGLERSRDFYLLDGLDLRAASGGMVEMEIQLHTYFRT